MAAAGRHPLPEAASPQPRIPGRQAPAKPPPKRLTSSSHTAPNRAPRPSPQTTTSAEAPAASEGGGPRPWDSPAERRRGNPKATATAPRQRAPHRPHNRPATRPPPRRMTNARRGGRSTGRDPPPRSKTIYLAANRPSNRDPLCLPTGCLTRRESRQTGRRREPTRVHVRERVCLTNPWDATKKTRRIEKNGAKPMRYLTIRKQFIHNFVHRRLQLADRHWRSSTCCRHPPGRAVISRRPIRKRAAPRRRRGRCRGSR